MIAQDDSGYQAGFGRAELTPPLGTPLRGYYHERRAEGVLDPLFARATVWQRGGERIVLAACDLCCVEAAWAVPARQRAAARAEVPVSHVVLCATHTHTAPQADPELAASWPERVEAAVAAALGDLAPCRVRRATTKAPPLAFNRRYRMRGGNVQTNPEAPRAEIEGPAGPVDETLNVLSFEAPDGARRGLLVHYGLHVDTVGGSQVSGDWPAALERELRGAWSLPALHAQFALAPCGDVNHFDFMNGRAVKGAAESLRIARALAQTIVPAVERGEALPEAPLSGREAHARLPLYRPSAEEAERARAVLARARDPGKDFTLPVVEATRVARTAKMIEELGPEMDVPLQVVQAGTWKLLAAPLELFVAVGQAMVEGLAPRPWVATLANDSLGYVPSAEAYRQGGYEVVSSNFTREAPGVLVEQARILLQASATIS